MTRRAWVLLVVGLLGAVVLAGVALGRNDGSAPFRPTAAWNMFPPAEWQSLTRRAGLRGLHVVSATSRHDGSPVALLAGERNGATCFLPVDGTTAGGAVCRLVAPLTLFRFRDGGWTELLGVARHDVAAVAATATSPTGPWTSGQTLVPVAGGYVFAGGSSGSVTKVVARDAQGHVLQRVSFS